jgi:hypothetical protein
LPARPPDGPPEAERGDYQKRAYRNGRISERNLYEQGNRDQKRENPGQSVEK